MARNLHLKTSSPEWNLFPYEKIKSFPAILWKLENLHKLVIGNPGKHHEMVRSFELVLNNY